MKKVLILDDSAVIRAELRAILTKLGCQVLEAANGADGLALAEQHRDVSLIVTDLHMPNVDGLAFCKKLHEAKIFGSNAPPIVVITTEIDQDVKNEAKRYGVSAWVLKPYEAAKVVSYFAKMLGV